MDFWLIRFTLTLTLAKETWSLPLGCSYNGTTYGEGETITTGEPCLSCACQGGSLACSLLVCADPPDPPSPGCFVVHKPNDCCPQLFCESFTENGVEVRTTFRAPTLEGEANGHDCLINGSSYAEGSALASSQLCEYCYCIRGEMTCIKPRCTQPFQQLKGCKPISLKSSCCPTQYDCRDADIKFLAAHIKTLAMTGPKVWNSSVRSLENLENDIQIKVKKVQEEEASESNDGSTEWLEKATDESFTEASTMTGEAETTPTRTDGYENEAENITDPGFQVTRFRNIEETSTAFPEETTWEPKTTASSEPDVSSPFAGGMKETSKLGQENFGDEEEAQRGEGVSDDETHGNPSQEAEDYDAYDYSEPKLPPSLPNLVIFPFVAADAVVKEESLPPPRDREGSILERLDRRPGFYNDYFSPPLRTEGGFVPKQPSPPDEPFYEYPYPKVDQTRSSLTNLNNGMKVIPEFNFPSKIKSGNCFSDGREVLHGEILSGMGECLVCTCQHGEVVCQDVPCPTLNSNCKRAAEQDFSCCGKILCEVNSSTPTESQRIESGDIPNPTPDPFEKVIRAEMVPDLSNFKTTESLRKNQEVKKPVTVAYKNVVVDYYPDHLITSTRGQFENSASENSQKHFRATTEESPLLSTTTAPGLYTLQHGQGRATTIHSIDGPSPSFDFTGEVDTSILTVTTSTAQPNISDENLPVGSVAPLKPSANSTTMKPSFFYEILKTFLIEETKEVTTISTSTKHKYSSKIKEQTTTWKPKMEELGRDEGSSFGSTNALPRPFNNSDDSSTVFSVEKAENRQPTEISFRQSIITEEKAKHSQEEKSESGSQETTYSDKGYGSIRDEPSGGTLLKLAGCNIYGRMYRVGRIILELSGPCLECLCTNLGVQCRPRGC